MASATTQPRRLLWFRHDLRIHDNETLAAAAGGTPEGLACVFVYDSRWDALTPEGEPRLGRFRKTFLTKSVLTLRAKLRELGSDLLLLHGQAEDLIPKICREQNFNQLFFSSSFAHDERRAEDAIQKRLSGSGVQLLEFANHTLLRPTDLPFEIDELPLVFSEFRRAVEASFLVPAPLPELTKLPQSLPIDCTDLSIWQADAIAPEIQEHESLIRGGEDSGLARLHEFVWESEAIATYKETRNGMVQHNDSSKLSAWLSSGCLSARTVYQTVQEYEQERVQNDSTYWLIFELLWRDYFHFLSLRSGSRIFSRKGVATRTSRTIALRDEAEAQRRFDAWTEGQTGYPLVDACMRELKQTGWMSNRGRQNVASFLAHDLALDWRAGARWFETYLIDYDACSNWGNWMYVAGVGTDPRARRFNVTKQARDYDPDGEYLRAWIPELRQLNGARAITPWEESANASSYPRRIV